MEFTNQDFWFRSERISAHDNFISFWDAYTFINWISITVIHKDGVDDDDDGEDEDILAGLMNSGLNSIPEKAKMQKRSKQPIKREHLKDVNIIEYIDKKMNEAASGTSGSPSMEENENSKNSTRKSTPEFKIPSSKGPLDGASSSGADSKKPKNFSAQYCNEVMNSDSIKPFNSGKF